MRAGRNVLVLLAFLALTLAATYPLPLHVASAIPGGGDSWIYYWNLWWVKRAFHLGISPYATTDIHFPYGTSLYFHTLNIAGDLFALPILQIAPIALAYDLLVFAAFVLGGYAAYHLARYVLNRSASREGADEHAVTAAAMLAGVIFAFSSYQYAHLLGHLDLVSTQWLPAFALFALKARDEPGRWNWVLGGGCLAMAALTTPYYLLFLLIFAGLLAADTVARRAPDWRALGRVAAAVLIGAILIAPILLPMLRLGQTAGRSANPLADSERFSADALSFVVPSPLHSLWGGAAKRIATSLHSRATTLETFVFIGYLPLALAAVGVRRGSRERTFWAIAAVAFFALALGPMLYVGGRAVPVISRVMPYRLVTALPYGDIPRVPARFAVMTILAISVLAAFGANALLRRCRGRRMLLVGGALIAGAFVEQMIVPMHIEAIAAPPFFSALAREPGRGAVVEAPIPADPSMFPRRMLWQTIHEKPVFGGYIARGLPQLAFAAVPGFGQFTNSTGTFDDIVEYRPDEIDAISRSVLNAYGAGFIAIEKRLLPDRASAERMIRAAESIAGASARFYDDDTVTGYRVPAATTAPLAVWLDTGWSYLERLAAVATTPGTKWHWMGAESRVGITAPRRSRITLRLNGRAFARPRRVRIEASGVEITTLTIGTDAADYETAPFDVDAGITFVTLRSLDGTGVPGADSRSLSVALYRMAIAERQQSNPSTSLDRLDQKDLPLDHTFHWTNDGAGVDIYIIDTGVRVTHDDFALKDGAGHVVGTRAKAFADCSGTGTVTCVAAPANGSAFDCESGYAGHGTHDASLAAGTTYGVAKGANIFAVRAVSNTTSGACQGDNPRAVEAAIRFVTQHAQAKPRIINLSFRPQDAGVNTALHDAIVAGFTVTLSAGGGQGTALANWGPYLAEHAIIAAASDANDISGCRYGDGLTLYAPAVRITAAGNRSDTHVYQGDQQPCVDSFAAPLAAGVAATYLQSHPAATPADVRQAMLNLAAVDKVRRRDGGRDSPLLLQAGVQ